MSVIGKGSLSLRKKDVREQKNLTIGFKKLTFAHKAAAGETGINLGALTVPTEMSGLGFVNPSSGELLAAQLYFYRKNLTLISSIRGLLMDYLSYDVASSGSIVFNGFTAAADEIFIGVIDYNARNGFPLVDAAPLVSTGLLADGETDFNVGQMFEVNKYSTQQVGAVSVYRNGVQQFRNTGNSDSVLDGNYYEVNNGSGSGQIIRFNNAASGSDDSILVISNGLLAYNPDGSALQQIETLAGQIDALIPVVSDLSGLPENDFQAAPNNVDLKSFGDIVLALLGAEVPIVTEWTSYTPTTNVTGGGTATTGQWRRVGGDVELVLGISWTSAPSAFSSLDLTLPSGLTIDTAKLTSSSADRESLGIGTLFDDDGGTTRWLVEAVYASTTAIRLRSIIQVSGASTIVHTTNVTNTSPFSIESNDYANIRVRLPIVGWAATQTLREQLGL